MVSIDTQTQWGKVAMIRTIEKERYYFMIDKEGGIAMIPADVVEATDNINRVKRGEYDNKRSYENISNKRISKQGQRVRE